MGRQVSGLTQESGELGLQKDGLEGGGQDAGMSEGKGDWDGPKRKLSPPMQRYNNMVNIHHVGKYSPRW